VSQTLIPQELIEERLKTQKTSLEKKQELQRLKSISDEATTLTFIFLLNKFFNEGSKAAKDAVDTFREFEVEGFYIGGNYFSGRNEKVIQGEELSRQLLDAIKDEEVKALIIKSHYMSEIINKYKNFI
jgi:hypothetical protein